MAEDLSLQFAAPLIDGAKELCVSEGHDRAHNDERRFRALCVEHLRREPNHTFRFGKDLVAEILMRMERLPAWKIGELV